MFLLSLLVASGTKLNGKKSRVECCIINWWYLSVKVSNGYSLCTTFSMES